MEGLLALVDELLGRVGGQVEHPGGPEGGEGEVDEVDEDKVRGGQTSLQHPHHEADLSLHHEACHHNCNRGMCR